MIVDLSAVRRQFSAGQPIGQTGQRIGRLVQDDEICYRPEGLFVVKASSFASIRSKRSSSAVVSTERS